MTPEVIIQREASSPLGNSRLPITVVGGYRRRDLLNLGGGQVGHQEEKQEIGRDVKIEIDESMHEEARASHQPRELQCPGKRMVELAHAFQGLGRQNGKKPSTAKPSQKTRLR